MMPLTNINNNSAIIYDLVSGTLHFSQGRRNSSRDTERSGQQYKYRSWRRVGVPYSSRGGVDRSRVRSPSWGKNDDTSAGHQLRWAERQHLVGNKIVDQPWTTSSYAQLAIVIWTLKPQKDKANLARNHVIGQVVSETQLYRHDREATKHISAESTRSCQMDQS